MPRAEAQRRGEKHLNRRIVRDETGGSGDLRHLYYNRQWQVLEERVEVSSVIKTNPLAQYVYHPQYVDSIALRDYDADTNGSSVRHYYLQDALFNVTALTDSAGTVVERYSYTPYGEATVLNASFSPVAGNNSAFSNELLYTGRRIDPATGLQLNRNRFYHQQLGRWINRDPIGYDAGDINLYGYVLGRPTFFWDPSGLQGHPGSNPRPKPKPDKERIRDRVSDNCPDCVECVEKLLDIIEFKIEYKSVRNQCDQWTEQFTNKHLRQESIWDCERKSNCYKIEHEEFNYYIGVPGTDWFLGHSTIKVTLCDGSTFYFDNGWWGGNDNIYDGDPPPYLWQD